MGARFPRSCDDLLDQQCGVIARWQAHLCGLDPAVIDGQLRTGRWQTLYRAVYATFTGTPSRQSLLWAAVLRCGPTGVLSYHTAAELDGLTDRAAAVIHVTISNRKRFVISGAERQSGVPPIAVHRSSRIESAAHPTRLPPRTRIEETALDLTQIAASLDQAVGWLASACGRRLTRPDLLRAAIESRERFRWRADLAAALDEIGNGAHSALEFRYVRDVERRHGLPTAIRQARLVAGSRIRYLDNLYAEVGVAVELDGQVAHPVEARWRDIHRDNALSHAGLVTLRYSWSDVTIRSCQTAEEISGVLRARGWLGQLTRCGSCPAPA
jgi:hypothetical protein